MTFGPDLCGIQTIKTTKTNLRKGDVHMSMDKLTQGEPGIPIRPPHPLKRQREGIPMNTRYTNTSTEENFHNSEMNLKMEDHYRKSMRSRGCGKGGEFTRRHNMNLYPGAIPGCYTRMMLYLNAIHTNKLE